MSTTGNDSGEFTTFEEQHQTEPSPATPESERRAITDRTRRGSADEIPEWITLEDDEEVIWISGPSRWTYVDTLTSALIGSFVVLYFVFNGSIDFRLGPVPIDYLLLYLVPAMVMPTILSEIESRNVTYVLTNEQLWYKYGLISNFTNPIQLTNVTTIEYGQSYKERLWSVGHVYVSTAGSHGYDMILEDLPKPRQKSAEIMQHQERQT
jgi:hypothetical protein